MNLTQAIEKLKKSKEFKSLKNCYLAHVFKMLDEANKDLWQIGYYNPDTDKIITFIVSKKIQKCQESDAFKKPGTTINKLDLSKVKIEIEKAISIAEDFQKKNYKETLIKKPILILQNLDLGQVWNITFVTDSFNVLNIKVDSATGKVLTHELRPVFEFQTQK